MRDGLRELLRRAADLGADFRESLPTRAVAAPATADELRAALGGPLPAAPSATTSRTLAAYAASVSSQP